MIILILLFSFSLPIPLEKVQGLHLFNNCGVKYDNEYLLILLNELAAHGSDMKVLVADLFLTPLGRGPTIIQ